MIARSASNWDAMVSARWALDREHHDVLRGILERCAAMTAEYAEDNCARRSASSRECPEVHGERELRALVRRLRALLAPG